VDFISLNEQDKIITYTLLQRILMLGIRKEVSSGLEILESLLLEIFRKSLEGRGRNGTGTADPATRHTHRRAAIPRARFCVRVPRAAQGLSPLPTACPQPERRWQGEVGGAVLCWSLFRALQGAGGKLPW